MSRSCRYAFSCEAACVFQILQVHEVTNDVEEAQLVKQMGANLEFMQLRDKSAVIGSIGRMFKPDVMIVRCRN